MPTELFMAVPPGPLSRAVASDGTAGQGWSRVDKVARGVRAKLNTLAELFTRSGQVHALNERVVNFDQRGRNERL